MQQVEKNILLVEDETGLAETLKFNLECDGYAVTLAHDGPSAIGLLSTEKFDAVVLDVMLPEIDGYQICKSFRETNTVTPVIFLTSRSSSMDRIHGLRLGANDYLGKPFEYDELLLRINNLTQRSTGNEVQQVHRFTFGNCSIDFEKMVAIGRNGEEVSLSKIEFQMMKFFILNKNKVIAREEIYRHIWGYKNKEIPNSRTLDNFIVVLRKYFENDPSEPQYIRSVRGVGYKFVI
jgi:two-component system, OmpR family, alkaline phosphatase synthesis response regulator PhoP